MAQLPRELLSATSQNDKTVTGLSTFARLARADDRRISLVGALSILPLCPPHRPTHRSRGWAFSEMKPPAAAMPAPSRQMFQASSGLSGLTLLVTLALIRHFSKPQSAASSKRGGARGERARSSSRAKVDAVSHALQRCRARRLAKAPPLCTGMWEALHKSITPPASSRVSYSCFLRVLPVFS